MIQSNQKSSQQKGFFAHKAFTPQSRQNHGLQNLAPTSFAPRPCASGKYCYALPPAAHIVLPAFVRSCFADERKNKPSLRAIAWQSSIETSAARKALP
ncbi:hypothetical protein [Mucilaginibacter sp. AK015]|uniref:hypothetical protein n=1 Tax=Mucilaginibacter sp. AK015 TaxID=2723072 RepID=UPI00161C75CA|nr:hypothetical protein [Mucilaginibacter sp. AK015]MBB5394112.1 hypothetical protein [Mucilaginibacter sp. AK015]